MNIEIKNLNKAAKRILKAIKDKEKIILYGDADLDGVASVIILKESIVNLGGDLPVVYFPDREKEGYGITETALKSFKNHAPALIVAADCGIGNFKEINEAKKLGFSVILIDHHEILDKLPKADIIVDPKQKGDRYLFKKFAATGLVYKTALALFGEKIPSVLNNNFLELTALATVADMMPKESENRIFIEQGLPLLKESFRPGIKIFFEVKEFDSYPDLNLKISKIISILNVRDVKGKMPASFRLLTAPSLAKAKEIFKKLLQKNQIRKEKIEKILLDVEKRIELKSDSVIFEGEKYFEVETISTVASLVSKKFQKPAFIFKKMEKESQGTVRTPYNIDAVSLMKGCSKYLLTFGGHPQAAGFRIKNENLDKFKEMLLKTFRHLYQ